jgi:WD40 repeat protein
VYRAPATGLDFFEGTLSRNNGITSMAISPDGRRLACGSSFGSVHLWDLRSGRQTDLLRGHTLEVIRLAFSPDGERLVSAGRNGVLKVWDLRSPGDALVRPGAWGYGSGLAMHPRKPLYAVGKGSLVQVCDLRSGRPVLTLRGHKTAVTSVAFSGDGVLLASREQGSGDVRVWDTLTGRERPLTTPPSTFRSRSGVEAPNHPVRVVVPLALSPDGKKLATSSWSHAVKVWDAQTGAELLALGPPQSNTEQVFALAFSPDGERLAAAGVSTESPARVWDVRTGNLVLSVRGPSAGGILAKWIWGLAFSPDGSQLALAYHDGLVRVFNARTGGLLQTLKGHINPVRSVSYSPDGRYLVSGGMDGTVRVWDLASGVATVTLHGHARDVRCVRFSADGRHLVALDGNGDVFLRDTYLFEEVSVMDVASHRNLFAVAWTGEGEHVSAKCRCGQVVTWDVHTRTVLPRPDPFPATAGPQAQTADGLRRAVLNGGRVVLFNFLTPEEQQRRRERSRPDLDWHVRQAADAFPQGQWFEAAFHLERVCRQRPQSRALYELAVSQLGAGQREAYRKTCGRMLARLGTVPQPGPLPALPTATDGAAALLGLARGLVAQVAAERIQAARACVLAPGAVAKVTGLPALAIFADPVTYAAALHRAGKHEDAVRILATRTGWRALLYRALAEHGRGKAGEARRALVEAVRQLGLPSSPRVPPLSPSERLESDLLRGEAEALLRRAGPR